MRVRSRFSVSESRTRPQFKPKARAPHRTSTIEAQDVRPTGARPPLWRVSPCVFLEYEPYERLTKMAQQARANEAQFLEHLILRAEAIYNFQPPVLPPPRPWWKLWSKEEREPELPAIVADLRNAA